MKPEWEYEKYENSCTLKIAPFCRLTVSSPMQAGGMKPIYFIYINGLKSKLEMEMESMGGAQIQAIRIAKKFFKHALTNLEQYN